MSPCRCGAATSTPRTAMPIVSRFAPESFTKSGFVGGAKEHPGVTSDLPVCGKRAEKQGERGEEAHEARIGSVHVRVFFSK